MTTALEVDGAGYWTAEAVDLFDGFDGFHRNAFLSSNLNLFRYAK